MSRRLIIWQVHIAAQFQDKYEYYTYMSIALITAGSATASVQPSHLGRIHLAQVALRFPRYSVRHSQA